MFKITPLKISVHPEGENPVFGERAIHIEIEDEAGGGFLEISQSLDVEMKPGTLRIELDELRTVLEAAEQLMSTYDAGV